MNRRILATILCMVCLPAMANSVLLKADKAYTTGNLTSLGAIYSADPQNRVINYLYAKAMLTKDIAKYAEDFVENSPNSYMRNDLIHQLLIFYFTNNSYSSYTRIFNLLNISQASTNEKCGFDYSIIMTGEAAKPILPENWLVSNNIPAWCADLVGYRYNKGKYSTKERNNMMYDLIINGKTDIFNQVAPDIQIKPINFYHYQSYTVSQLPSGDSYKFLVVYRIALIAHKDPDSGLSEMKRASLDSGTKAFLGNYLAMQFAQKHNFAKALDLYSSYENEYMTDEELEWRTRSYMYAGKWSKVVDSIEEMPKALKTKNVWLYWEGRAYANLKEETKANNYFDQIPSDYSYYSMLAQSALDNGTEFKAGHPTTTELGSSQVAVNAKSAFTLYQIGKSGGSKNLVNIATAEWNYAAKQSTDPDLLAMSNLAARQNVFDLSIYAANQMTDRYIELSFPAPFLSSYIKYSSSNGIDKSYPLAISRQESRFNYNVIAFDGGVGLMQIMPQTGAYIAKKSGSSNCFRQSPECNIKFGSWYLGNLYSKFGGDLIYSTAAYNAGPGRARRWQDTLGQLDNTVQIELIPIQITRDYVQKVLTNKAAYDSWLAHQDTVNLLPYITQISKNHYVSTPDDDHTDAQVINN